MWLRSLILWLLLGVSATTLAEFDPLKVRLRKSAMSLLRGHDGYRDYDKAYRLFCIAAALDDTVAMHRLGWMYFKGRGVAKNKRIAMGWVRLAATLGNRQAMKIVQKYTAIPSRGDNKCPIVRSPKQMTMSRIRTWAIVLGLEFEVDPRLVMAVIKTESNFNPTARSPVDAYGLMQLMAATARRFSVDRRSPVQNMIGGVLYLRWLLRYFRGNVKLALAGYNAGEHAVRRHRGMPPFKETRRYVRKILFNYRRTRHPVPKPLLF